MVKGASGGGKRARGIQRGVQRHKVKTILTPDDEPHRQHGRVSIPKGIPETDETNQDQIKNTVTQNEDHTMGNPQLLIVQKAKIQKNEPTLLGVRHATYFHLGRTLFATCSHACQKLRLVGFKQLANGTYVRQDLRDTILRFVLLFVGVAAMGHKICATVVVTARQGLGLQTCCCIAVSLYFINSFCVSLGVVARPGETADVINSWRHVFHLTGDDRLFGKPVPLEDILTVLKLLTAILLYQVIALAVSMASIAGPFTTMPVFLLPTIESFGLIPAAWPVPRLVWQLLVFPLEYAIFLQTALAGSLCGSIFIVSVGIQKFCVDRLG